MKKKNKIIITIIVILLLILLLYFFMILRNITIINQLIAKGSELSQEKSFSYQTSINEKNTTDGQFNVATYSKKNAISKLTITNQLEKDTFTSIFWKDTSTNEGIVCSINTTNIEPNKTAKIMPATETSDVGPIPTILSISYPIQNQQNKIILAMSSWIQKETIENEICYKLSVPSSKKTYYFNEERGNLVIECNDSTGTITKFTNLTLTITDDQIAKPNLDNFTIEN